MCRPTQSYRRKLGMVVRSEIRRLSVAPRWTIPKLSNHWLLQSLFLMLQLDANPALCRIADGLSLEVLPMDSAFSTFVTVIRLLSRSVT